MADVALASKDCSNRHMVAISDALCQETVYQNLFSAPQTRALCQREQIGLLVFAPQSGDSLTDRLEQYRAITLNTLHALVSVPHRYGQVADRVICSERA